MKFHDMVSTFNFPKKTYTVPGQVSPIPISMTEGATAVTGSWVYSSKIAMNSATNWYIYIYVYIYIYTFMNQ